MTVREWPINNDCWLIFDINTQIFINIHYGPYDYSEYIKMFAENEWTNPEAQQ